MQGICYLDNSATTFMCQSAVDAMNSAVSQCWGNPSSLHSLGVRSEELINSVRQKTAQILSAQQNEIFFTASGTESNNIAIFSAAKKGERRGKRIITTVVEHPSVANCFAELEKQGFEVVYLKTDKYGIVSAEEIYSAVNSETILVSIMLVNNELGGINPVKTAASAIKRAKAPALLHCDAVQAFGKMDINPSALGVDLMSISAHKVHGPKGLGVLYKKKGIALPQRIFGGGQESGLRSGTEAVHQIAAFGGALDELDIKNQYTAVSGINKHIKERLINEDVAKINSSEEALPYILSISVEGYRSETLMHALELKGIYVSSGSACSKGNSGVLISAGLDEKTADSTLRISFSRYNTVEDADRFVDALKEVKELIVKSER